MTDRMSPAGSLPAATVVRRLMRGARKAALGTLRPPERGPFVSLVAVATALDASPLMLLSDLAVHTRNLRADPRASLLFDGTGSAAEPLTGPRASLEGVIEVVDPAAVQERYFVRHPDAKAYAGFKDFRFYRLQVERAHLVEGFGRITEVPAQQILQPANVLEAGWSDIALALQVVADLIKNTNCHVVDLDPDGFELDSGYGRAWYPYLRTVSRSAEAPGAVQEALASGAGQAE